MTRPEQIRKIKRWGLFEVFIPLIFVLGLFPVCYFLNETKNSYEVVFASGDVLTLGGFWLLAMSLDLEDLYTLSSSNKESVDSWRYGALAFSIVVLGAYGFLKAKYLAAPSLAYVSPNELVKYTWMAHVSLAALLCCFLYCLYVRLSSIVS